jgi:hypothetical protein
LPATVRDFSLLRAVRGALTLAAGRESGGRLALESKNGDESRERGGLVAPIRRVEN